MWRNVMTRALSEELISERFTFNDIRAKAASDAPDDQLLGHQDKRTLERHYKRKAIQVTPLQPIILDNSKDIGQGKD